LQEFPVKAALRRDNEMIAHWQLHVTILCPVECDYVIEDSLHYILKGARTHDAHRHLTQHSTSLRKAVPVELLLPFFDVG
jgi:hypothetical protein